MARRVYHGPGAVLLPDRTYHRWVEDPPLPKHPPRGEHLGGAAQKTEDAPLLGRRHVKRLVVRQVKSDGGITAQDLGHLPGLGDGRLKDAPPMGPLKGEILQKEKPELVAGFVKYPVRHV